MTPGFDELFSTTRPEPPATVWQWGVVVTSAPLEILLEGDTNAITADAIDVLNALTLTEGTRVWCQLTAGRVLVLGNTPNHAYFRSTSDEPEDITWAATRGGFCELSVHRVGPWCDVTLVVRPGTTAHAVNIAAGLPTWARPINSKRVLLNVAGTLAGNWALQADADGDIQILKYNGAPANASTTYMASATTWLASTWASW